MANLGGLCNVPAWLDSGHVLAQTGPDNTWSSFDIETGGTVALAEATGCCPTVSPDGGTIGWYDGASDSGMLLTDADGTSQRRIPFVDGVSGGCPGTVLAAGPASASALVSRPTLATSPAVTDPAAAPRTAPSWTPDPASPPGRP